MNCLCCQRLECETKEINNVFDKIIECEDFVDSKCFWSFIEVSFEGVEDTQNEDAKKCLRCNGYDYDCSKYVSATDKDEVKVIKK